MKIKVDSMRIGHNALVRREEHYSKTSGLKKRVLELWSYEVLAAKFTTGIDELKYEELDSPTRATKGHIEEFKRMFAINMEPIMMPNPMNIQRGVN